jgi:hypothetical protein
MTYEELLEIARASKKVSPYVKRPEAGGQALPIVPRLEILSFISLLTSIPMVN